jgi:EmrB/QacA subfamily drug resistance transporter
VTLGSAWEVQSLSAIARRRLTLAAMAVAQAMIMIDVTIVNTALPAIQRDLHMSPGSLVWVISAYALSLATLIPLGGALGDRYGRKRLFLLGMAVFTLGSVACALSPTDTALIASRALQGAGGAVMSALTLSILTTTYSPETRAGAIGVWAAFGGLGFGLGPVLGGVLLNAFSWSSVFWVNVPVGLIGLVVTTLVVAESRSQLARHLDVVGVVISALGLFGVTFGLIESSSHPWASVQVLAPLAGGVALLVGFALWERRTPTPMLPPSLMRARSFVTGCSIYVLAYVALEGVLFYVTLLFQNADGWSPLRTGVSWLAMNVPFLCVAQFAGRLNQRFASATVITAGCLIATVGIGALSFVTTTSPFLLAAVGYILLGVGYGMLNPGTANVAMRDVPLDSSGAAAGVLTASRQVGISVGLAVLGSIGVNAALTSWRGQLHTLPAGVRGQATQLGSHVASAQVGAVTAALGSAARDTATTAFTHGYRIAVSLAAGAVLAAAVVALLGLRVRVATSPGVDAVPVRVAAPAEL